MNRKRSRLDNTFPIEVHRANEERESYVEVVREDHEPQQDTPRSSQVNGMGFGK